MECHGHPVAMMCVDIDIGDAVQSHTQQVPDRQHRFVDVAKTIGPIGQPVMGATTGIVGDTPCPYMLGRQQPTARRRCGASVDLGKHWVRQCAQIKGGICLQGGLGALQGCDVSGGVKVH